MNRIFIYILLALLGGSFAQAQKEEDIYRSTPYMIVKVIDTAVLKCDYRYLRQEGHLLDYWTVLQVGKHLTKFVGDGVYQTDSMGYVLGNKPHPKEVIDRIEAGFRPNRRYVEKFYVNYPEGKLSIIDRVFMDNHLSEEENSPLKWTMINDSTKMIAGYSCQKAEIDLYGRHWIAWYTEEIPYPTGPWLLRGLPGLIVEAYSADMEHRYKLYATQKDNSPIVIKEYPYFKSRRDIVLKQKKKYYDNMVGHALKLGMIKSTASNPAPRNTGPRPYNPHRKLEGIEWLTH